MKLRFLPKGGFNKNGAFIEYDGDEPTGKEPKYERSEFTSFDIAYDQLEIQTSALITDRIGKASDTERAITKCIKGKGTIQPSRLGRFTLSFFGRKKAHKQVSLTISPSNEVGEAASFGGLYFEGDMDLEGFDEFYLEINVHMSRFDALASELAEAGAKLSVRVAAHNFPNFYATWSPANDDGRKLKYLREKSDVENAEDIPESFWPDSSESKKMRGGQDNTRVIIRVFRPLNSSNVLTEYDDKREIEDDDPDFLSDPSTAEDIHSHRIEHNNAILALVDAAVLLNAQVKRTGFWIIVCLAVLVLVTLFA